MHSLQKMSFSVLLCGILVASLILFTPTDTLGALPKKKLEIIIGGDNFCKDDKDCAGDSFCNMTSHICIACPPPFEWEQNICKCPTGTVPNADNTDCVECLDDSDCTTLKEATSWYCDTGTNMCIHCPSPKEWHADTNTCECPSGTHIVRDSCICDNPNKTLVDGLCQCQIDQKSCSSSDFMGEINCACCPDDKPVWNKASGELAQCVSCADVDATKTYYNSVTKTCEECLIDEHCENEEVCSVDKTCVCELDKDSCSNTDFAETKCACCPTDKPKWDNVSGTCKACSEIDATKPYYNSDTKTCEECLTDEDCENEKVCSVDKTCICEMTGTECTLSDFNATQCMCCPAETPVYDAATGTCKTCEEMHPEWAETGTAYDITTKQCWPYCGKEEFGVVMLVDRSGSTKATCSIKRTLEDGTTQTLHCCDLITEALESLVIPENMKLAMYLNSGSVSDGDVYRVLSYGYHGADAVKNAIPQWVKMTGNYTTFEPALEDITENICPTGDNLIVMMWTDGELTSTDAAIKKMKEACKNVKFYYIGPSENTFKAYYAGYYAIKSLPDTYASHLNGAVRKEGCILKDTEVPTDSENLGDDGVYGDDGNIYVCSNLRQSPITTKEACDSCGEGTRVWRSAAKDCISCRYASGFTSTKAECSECNGRYFSGSKESSGTCYLCNNVSQYPSASEQECDSCGAGVRVWRSAKKDCISCDYASNFTSTKDECLECDNRYFIGTNDSSGTCYSCDNVSQYPTTTEQECDFCGEGARVWRSAKKDCISCSYTSKFTSTKDECLECDNRYFVGTNDSSGACYSCDNTSQYPVTSEQECDSCGEGVRVWRSAKKDCISCGYTSKFTSTRDECLECTNRYFSGGYCYSCFDLTASNAKNITDKNNCLSCEQAIWTDEGSCAYCPSDSQNAERTKCENNYLGSDNIYYACDNISQYKGSSEQECDSCGEGVRVWRSAKKDCISCSYTSKFTSTKDECLECDNRYWTGTNEGSGSCYLCSTITEANAKNITDKNSCLNCEQTVWTENGICAYCPPENQINNRSSCQGRYLGTNNISYACDNASQYLASVEQECDSCGEGVRVWRSAKKDCISCSYTSKFTSTKDECLECDNRYFVGTNEKSGYCYLCPTGQKRNQEGVCE